MGDTGYKITENKLKLSVYYCFPVPIFLHSLCLKRIENKAGTYLGLDPLKILAAIEFLCINLADLKYGAAVFSFLKWDNTWREHLSYRWYNIKFKAIIRNYKYK